MPTILLNYVPCRVYNSDRYSFNHAPAFYRARWLAKATRQVKTRDAIAWQRKFPVGFPVEVFALNSLFINISMMLLV